MFLNAILIIDYSNRIIFANSKAEKLFKINRKTLIETSIVEILTGIENFISFNIPSTREKREFQTIETTFNLPNGDYRYLCVKSFPILEGTLLVLSDQTTRKQSEQKLKVSEEKYRFLVENAQEGIWIIDSEAKTSFVNQFMADILGYSRDEMLGQPLFAFMDENAFELGSYYLERRQQGITENHNFEFLSKDGTKVYTDLKTAPLLNERGEYDGAFAFVSDITEKRLIEQRLKESEEKYRLIIENANDLITILNSKYESEFINEKIYLKLLGYSEEDLVGKSALEFVHPDDQKKITERLLEGFERGEGIEECRIRKKDGTYTFFELKGQTFIDGNGESKAVVISRDITDRKNIEEDIKNSEKKFRIAAENSFMGIAIIQDNVIKYGNQKLAEIFGYTIEEMMNWPPLFHLTLVHPDDQELAMEQSRKKQADENDVIPSYQFKGVTKSSEQIFLEIYSKTILLDGKSAILAMFNDITEKKAAETRMEVAIQEIENQNQKLIELDKAKDEMLETISHELRTPLVSILGFIELLSSNDSNFSGEQKDNIKVLKRNTQRLNQLVERILDADRLEMGKVILNIESFDFQKLVNSVLETLSNRIKQKMHKIFVHIPPNFKIQADEELIHQVISNLLTNAIKYTPDRGTISIKVKKHGLKIIFSIKDTGIGINQEEIPKLFQKFQRISSQGEKGIGDAKGIGLGLYISKKIIELHGGKMWIESEGLNCGSTFYFELPIQS